MGSLIILYVTAEQETDIRQLYMGNGWIYNNLVECLSEDVKNEVFEACVLPNRNGLISSCVVIEHEKFPNAEIFFNGQDSIEVTAEDVDSRRSSRVPGRGSSITKAERGRGKRVIKEKKGTSLALSKKSSNIKTSKEKHLVESRTPVAKRKLRSTSSLSDQKVDINRTKATHEFSEKDEDEIVNGVTGVAITETENDIFPDSIAEENNSGKIKSTGMNFDMKSVEKGDYLQITDEPAIQILTAENMKNVGNEFKCSKCSYLTKVRSNLNRHVKEMHSGVRHKCSKCNKTFKGKHDAKMHDLYGHTSGLNCKECDKTFTSVSGLRNHVKIKHKKSNLYQCKHCDKKFYYKSHYLGHVNKHLDVKPFNCKRCQKPFRYKVACHLHEKTCSRENFYSTHNPDGSLKEVAKSKFLCDICGLELTSKSGLKLHHYYTHAEDTTTICSLCGKSFKGTYSLQRHMRNIHENSGTVYPCPKCGKEFSQQQILKQHIKIHKKAYTCFCETCGKGFLSRFKMIEHTRMHTGEKPFSCPHCQNFKCATKTNLQKHLKIHEEGRVPRQKKEKKEQKRKDKTLAERKQQGEYTKKDSCVEEVFIPSQVTVDPYARSESSVNEEVKYANLPHMVLDSSKYSHERCFNYDHLLKNQGIDCSENDRNKSDITQKTSLANRENEYRYGAYQVSAKGVEDSKERLEYNLRKEENQNSSINETNYLLSGNSENEDRRHLNYNMQSNVTNTSCHEEDGYYTTDASEIPQGLSILTVAMNIVNPSEY